MRQAPNPWSEQPQRSTRVGGAAKLFIEGVDVAVSARVTHADRDGMTLRQELPFLQLQSPLRDHNGRRAELTSVGVTVREGTPSLVLEVRYAGRSDEATTRIGNVVAKAKRDATVPYVFDDPYDHALGAPAAPLTPLSVPIPPPKWHVVLWKRLRLLVGRFF